MPLTRPPALSDRAARTTPGRAGETPALPNLRIASARGTAAFPALCLGLLVLAPILSPAARADDTRPVVVVGITAAEGTDARDQWLPTAVEETLGARLRRAPGVLAIPTVRAYQARREIGGERAEPPPAWPAVLRALGAQQQISGETRGHADALELRLDLAPLAGAGTARTRSFGPARLFDVLDQATGWLLDELDVPPDDRAPLLGEPARTPSAVEYYARAIVSARAGDGSDALFFVRLADQYDNQYAPAQLMLAELEARSRDPELRRQANLRLRRLLRLARERADPLLELDVELRQARESANEGAFDAALARLEHAARLADDAGDLYGRLAARSARSDVLLARAASAGPDDGDARSRDLEAAVEELVGIERELERVGDVVSRSPTASRVAMILEQLERPDAALAAYERACAAAVQADAPAGQASALMFIGQLHRKQGATTEAIGALRRCLELAPPPLRPKVRIALAQALEAGGERAEALTHYRTAFNTLSQTDDLANQLLCLMSIADLQQATGDRAAAIATLQQAIDVAMVLESPIEQELRDRRAALQRP